MSNSLVTVNKEKVLPDERYDEKLFKQAYKAGLEAKEFEKKKSKKKKILFFSSVLLSTALLVGLSLFLLSFRKEKFEYVESALPSQQSVYSSITEDAQLKG